MVYLLKASGIVIILFLFYDIFLKNETFFKSIRSYFLVGLLIVISIPLIEIPIYVEQVSSQLNLLNYQEITINSQIEKSPFDWRFFITLIYLLGVTFFSLKFIIQLISLAILLSKHPFIKQDGYYYVETSKKSSPFSFFNIIIYNKSQFTSEELNQIMNHEKTHVSHWHSFDTILTHLLVITLWFNPFVWLYKKAVLQNLEFIADSLALKITSNQKLYQLTLLKTCGANYCTEITNNFYNSFIKKRIIMLHKNQSKNKNQWKYALLLPLLIAFVATFNTKTIAQEKKGWEIKISTIDLIIDKNSTDESLKKESDFFKKEQGIELTFKGIKRNSTNEITAIKIEAKGKDIKATFENNGNEAIKPIKISYELESNKFSIGNVSKKDKMSIHEIHKLANTYYSENTNDKGNKYTVTATYFDDDSEFKIDSIENIEVKEIIINGKKENVWIEKQKKGSGENINIEIIKEGDSINKKLHKIKEIHIDSDTDDDIKVIEENGDNDFILKTDSKKVYKYIFSKKGNTIFLNSEQKNALYFVDGKEITFEEMKKISPDDIEKIEVLKGKTATEKYGEKAKNGVILITTKKE